MHETISSVNEIPAGSHVALYGAGGLGQFVCEEITAKRDDIKITGFIDDHRTGDFCGFPVFHSGKIPAVDLILITTSYFKDVEKKLQEKKIGNYAVFNPIPDEHPETETVSAGGIVLKAYTPNKLLRHLAVAFPEIEPGTLNWIDSFSRGDVFYDIGASNGLYGIYAAIKKESPVVAVEADAQNHSIVEMNHYLNRSRVKQFFGCFHIALYDKTQILPLYCINYGAGHHDKVVDPGEARGSKAVSGVAHVQLTIAEPLDEMIRRYDLPFPAHIKIDVDGAERAVIGGARNTLHSPRLKTVLIELTDEEARNGEIPGILKSAGFREKEKQQIFEIIGTPVHHVYNYLFVR